MIDHVGFPVSNYARSKAFYEKALAPLGYTLIMEVGPEHTESGSPAAGFGANGKPDFWIGAHRTRSESKTRHSVTSAFGMNVKSAIFALTVAISR